MKTITLFLALCVAAAVVPLRSIPERRADSSDAFPGWMAAPLPAGLTTIAPGAREVRFAADFPGRIGVFTDGTRTYIVRWVHTPTRKLHPAADCLRALGYAVKPMPVFAGADGSRWGVLSAKRGPDELRVRERIVDLTNHAWSDISAWFWSAALNQTSGPWWALTILEPAELFDSERS